MKNKLYTVQAYRWGKKSKHSYIVGVFTKKNKALVASDKEEADRGSKYLCVVAEWAPDSDDMKIIQDHRVLE